MLSDEYILSARVGCLFKERGLSNIDKTTNIDKTAAWSATEQCAEFAMKIVDYAKLENVTIDTAMDVKADEYIDLVNESCEDHGWDDYCRGFIVGEISGMNVVTALKAEAIWRNNMNIGYYQDCVEYVMEQSEKGV